MSSFTRPLCFELAGERVFRLTEPFEYHVGEYPSDSIISVPVGFETDLASVPRVFWPLFPPHGSYAKAAVIHDYLYQTRPFVRKRCDQIFLEGMEVLGVHRLARLFIYVAVRCCGARYFKETHSHE